ncbi:MAG: hypothetical protein IKC24_01000 [Oscillospiraceae bacterium]|nr:hypothetical protein [Oscillospiraceae bacterium]MBR6677985.1 hypothetical protein [Oscillospiraceae bacterium]
MSKAVMISIQPRWCELIARGAKTLEVRKNKPKLETPFKCYIYCTDNKGVHDLLEIHGEDGKIRRANENVIGEFVCDRISPIAMTADGLVDVVDLKTSCLSVQELLLYSAGKLPLYGWHISDLLLYDKPKPLSEFQSYNCGVVWKDGYPIPTHEIKRPPQSWCYVREGGTDEDS